MKNKHYPTKDELNEKWWHRMGIVMKWGTIVAAFLAPVLMELGTWYLDGLINAFLWYIILIFVRILIMYIIYGKAPDNDKIKAERKKRNIKSLGFLVILGLAVFFAWNIVQISKVQLKKNIPQMVDMSYHINKPEYQDTIHWWFSDDVDKDWANSQWKCYKDCKIVLENQNNKDEVWSVDLTHKGCHIWTKLPNESKELLMSKENFCAYIQCVNGVHSKKFCWNGPDKK